MLAALPDSGKQPDEWTDGPVAFGGRCDGHHRLPGCLAFDPRRGLADVRVDDRPALCEALGVPRAECDGIADGALLLNAYACGRRDCAHHLLGDYGLHRRAEAALQQRLAMDPRNAGALLRLGDLQRRRGNFRPATEAYGRLCTLRPGDRRAPWLRGSPWS